MMNFIKKFYIKAIFLVFTTLFVSASFAGCEKTDYKHPLYRATQEKSK